MVGLIIIGIFLWLAYEIWRAPLVDENYKVIRPTKTLKDLFKKRKS